MGFQCQCKLSRNLLEIEFRRRHNRFYLFGGKDESSAALIQGVTLAGVLLDEVALMPRSFVEQALARCSVAGSKFFFNCNPEHPFHWFYQEWICKSEQKNALVLHFTMEDNPSLTPQMRKRYQNLYAGVFYRRFILGEWTAPSGLVYPMFDPTVHVVDRQGQRFDHYYISCDYGITNPTSMGLWGVGTDAYRMREYYDDSAQTGIHRTDEDYYQALEDLAGDLPVEAVTVDPSATSFIQCIRSHHRFPVLAADNQVAQGIGRVSELLKQNKLLFSPDCQDSIREFSLYCWDESSRKDTVRKLHDHAMDDIRYFVNTVFYPKQDDFFVFSLPR